MPDAPSWRDGSRSRPDGQGGRDDASSNGAMEAVVPRFHGTMWRQAGRLGRLDSGQLILLLPYE